MMDGEGEAEVGLLEVLGRIRTLNEDRVQFFAQLATIIPAVRDFALQDNDDDLDVPESKQFWHRVLQLLVERNHWRGVFCLFNPLYIRPGGDQWSLLHGRAVGLSVDDIRVCDLLQSTSGRDLKAWGICLAVWLLKHGARVELISSDRGESLTIAAVKISLKAGVSDLLSYVLEMRPELTLSLDDGDQAGDSPLHLCVKFQQPNADSGVSVVLQTLLDLGCCTSVRDRQLKTPIQYVEEPDPRHTMLSQAADHAGSGLKDRVWKMKTLGDDHFQKDEFEESLSWYKKALGLAESAPNMKIELALLHSSCSCVYANLAVSEDRDLASATSKVCKDLCESKDDLAAVISNIRNPNVTPKEERSLECPMEETKVAAIEKFYVNDDGNNDLSETFQNATKEESEDGEEGDDETHGPMSLTTRASKNTTDFAPKLQEVEANTKPGHTFSSDEDGESDRISEVHDQFGSHVQRSSFTVDQPKESFDERTLLQSSDCTTMVEIDKVMVTELPSTFDLMTVSNELQEIRKTYSKEENELKEINDHELEGTDRNNETTKGKVEIPLRPTNGQDSNQLEKAEKRHGTQSDEIGGLDENQSDKTDGKDEYKLEETYGNFENLLEKNSGKEENQSSLKEGKDESLPEVKDEKDENRPDETNGKDENQWGQTDGKDEIWSEETDGKDENQSGKLDGKNENLPEETDGKDENQSGKLDGKNENRPEETDGKDEHRPEETDGKEGNLLEESDGRAENDFKGTDWQFENQSIETSRIMENCTAEINQKNENLSEQFYGKSENRCKEKENTNKNRATDELAETTAKADNQKGKTQKSEENQSAEEDLTVECQSEVSDNQDHTVNPLVTTGRRSSQTSLVDVTCEAVGESTFCEEYHPKCHGDNRNKEQATVGELCEDTVAAKNEKTAMSKPNVSQVSNSDFLFDEKRQKKTKRKRKPKQMPQPISLTEGQTIKGDLNEKDDKQDEDKPLCNPEKKHKEERTEHQYYQVKKTLSECQRSIIETIQDEASDAFKETTQGPMSFTRDSTEVGDSKHTDEMNDMADDNDEELVINTESFDKATWEIECTANAWKQLKENNVPVSLRQQIVKHVEQLAIGVWKNVPRQIIQGKKDVYATKVSKSLKVFMLWEIAVAFSGRCSDEPDRRIQEKSNDVIGGRIYTEIIRIWGVVFSEQDMRELADSIDKSHIRAEDCILKKRLRVLNGTKYELGTKRRIPRQFSEALNDGQGKTIMLCPPASPHKTEYHILKFYVFSSALVNILLHVDTNKVDLPFKVTHREHAIIHLQAETPILLLGRSGTGKTTCCLYRLWNNFISYWQIQDGRPFLPRVDYLFGSSQDAEDESEMTPEEAEHLEMHADVDRKAHIEVEGNDEDADNEDDDREDDDEEDDYGEYDHLHQMFVTKNPVLCHEVKKNFLEFCSAHVETQEHVDASAAEIPANLQDVRDLSYPLFLTSRQLLLMLDASVGPPQFFARNDDGSLEMKVEGWEDVGEENTILLHQDFDDEDEFAEVDIRHDEEPQHFPHPIRRKQDPRKEVTYDVFVEKVWPKIQKKIGVRYHPSLVWTEMMSFIMGSQEALLDPKGYLQETEYMEIGKKRAPNFSGDRSKIYELFRRYLHFKSQHQMFDEADFVRHIFKRLNKLPELPWVLHQLYVDETQDFTQSELSVLLRITQNPNSMFLTGDTAQGIMRGISFRFCDLKTLFHHAKTSLQRHQMRNLNEPKEVYQLIHSYRSHVGILSLASSVLELMVEFFPESFDRLKKDQGLFHGPQPILLESCSVDDLMILMQGNNRDTSHIEFGAHQAILVVNQEAKAAMPPVLYNNSIVLTIFESKGLEFDDVLLYNFFTDSEASKEWRVVTRYLESLSNHDNQEDDLDNVQKIDHEMLRQPNRPRALDFDPTQHKVLNSELKNLYTALTRARVNVWLFDEDEDKRAPMFDYFKARMLVRSVSVSDRLEDNSDFQDMIFAMKSSESDWVRRGDEMMAKSLYDTASKCYEMGFDMDKRNLALAHSQAQRARRKRDSPREMKEAFIRAADMFFQCGEALKGTQCLQNAQEFELAAKAYFRMNNLLDAARMFQRARNFTKACECLIGKKQYGSAVHMLDKAELFEQAIDCLKKYEEEVRLTRQRGDAVPQALIDNKPQVEEKDLWWKVVKSLHNQHKEREMLKALRNLPREEHLEYLEKHKFYKDAADLMLEDVKSTHTDAAEMLLRHGALKLALEYAEKGTDSDVMGKCHHIIALNMMSSKETEMTDNQDLKKKIVDHLEKAKSAFRRSENSNSAAMSVYYLSTLTRRIRDAKEAYDHFRAVKPFPNQVGMIESWRIVVDSIRRPNFQDCKNLIMTINELLSVIRTLLEQSDPTQRNMYKIYMQFYGLHEDVMNQNSLLAYPKHNPLCGDIIPNFYTKNERREETVTRDKETMSFQVSLHLGQLLHHLIDVCKKWLNPIAARSLQCRSFIEGRDLGLGNTCRNAKCQYLHEAYHKSSARTALVTMFWKVNLEGIVSQGVKDILGIASKTKERMQELRKILPKTTFESCIEFLDFVMSHHCYTGFSDSRDLIGNPSVRLVRRHVQNFLQKGTNLEERCDCVDWIVRGFTFNELYRLEIDMHKECYNVETLIDSDKKQLAFLRRQRGNDSLVELFGRIFLDSCEHLQKNVEKAVFSYTKYVKILSDRNKLAYFPKWPLFLFWHETFLTVALVTLTKISKGSLCVLPASYLQALSAVDTCLPKSKIQQLVNDTEMEQSITAQFQRRIVRFAAILCGYQTKMNLLKEAGNNNRLNFLLFERCLVLALVILANISMFSPLAIQDELMETIQTMELVDCLPKRLECALKATQNAKGISDVVAALHQLLQNRESEQLFCCKWSWKPKQKEGIEREQIKSFEMFLSTFPSELEEENEVDPDVEMALDETEDEDLKLADDDFEKHLEEVRIYQQQQLEDKAAGIIQRFFKKITFRGRLETGNLKQNCIRQEIEEFLLPYKVTQTMCGICSVVLTTERAETLEQVQHKTDDNIAEDLSQGITIDNTSCQSIAMTLMQDHMVDETVEAEKEEEKAGSATGLKVAETHPKQEDLETYDAHVSSSPHQVNVGYFTAFKELYEEYFLIQLVPAVHRFVTSLRNKEIFIENLFQQLVLFDWMLSTVISFLNSILKDRKWNAVFDLRSKVKPLFLHYTKASEEAEKWKQYFMQLHQHQYQQQWNVEQTIEEIQPTIDFNETGHQYNEPHPETLEGDDDDLVNVEYLPSTVPFDQHDDNQFYQQHQTGGENPNQEAGLDGNKNRNWTGRGRGGHEYRGQGNRRYGDEGGVRGRYGERGRGGGGGRGRQPRGNGERNEWQPRGNGERGEWRGRGNGERGEWRGRGQRGYIRNPAPRHLRQQQLQKFNYRTHRPNMY